MLSRGYLFGELERVAGLEELLQPPRLRVVAHIVTRET